MAHAKDVARDWYLSLLGKLRVGDLKAGKTFADAAERFIDEFEVITKGARSPIYVKGHRARLTNYLVPFFGQTVLGDITAGMVQDYRIHRLRAVRDGTPPAPSTLHQEIVCLRQVLKAANRRRWLDQLPDLSAPFRGSTKVSHRAWLSPDDYKLLYTATRQHAQARGASSAAKDLHDYVLFMVNTGLRPDEASHLEYRDVTIATDEATGDQILEISVRGKRGVGWCKSMPGAVVPFQRLRERHNDQPADRLFPNSLRSPLNVVLEALDLKFDREGRRRTAYSLRHTYISMRLIEGADIYQVAKNCRTSVEMIETYYAAHIKDVINAVAINVRKGRRSLTTANATLSKPVRKARRSTPVRL
ncbi:site-specific integrase [Caulobacter sp.]|uniref:tyrosine-type recombinase/integrase n=1 Tax=Caulobacter sp. TaxID=78 RepID=UPI001B1C705C|nr:site-specific integrase [Caulobacter sp.]MBO9545636.1 site-specific integrase [Caulobacter sp.]